MVTIHGDAEVHKGLENSEYDIPHGEYHMQYSFPVLQYSFPVLHMIFPQGNIIFRTHRSPLTVCIEPLCMVLNAPRVCPGIENAFLTSETAKSLNHVITIISSQGFTVIRRHLWGQN